MAQFSNVNGLFQHSSAIYLFNVAHVIYLFIFKYFNQLMWSTGVFGSNVDAMSGIAGIYI